MEVWIRQAMGYRPDLDRPMPFPVPGWMWDADLGQELYDRRLDYIRRVEELGFDGLIFVEHHYGAGGGLTPSPTLMMAAASPVTSRIKLITMGIILSLHAHPVRVAEELAMVDNLSHGRVVAGFISGNPESHYAYGMPGAEGRARHVEAYDLIQRAWTDENPFEWHGEFFDYDCVSILPRPVQKPHPPVWTAAGNAESLEWAAERRVGLIASGPVTQARETLGYYQQFAESQCGWTPTAAQRGMSRELFMAPTMAEVRDVVEHIIVRDRENAPSPEFQIPSLQELEKGRYTERSYTFLSAARSGRLNPGGRTLETVQERGQYIVGDPDSVTEQIIHHHEVLDTDVLVLRPELGGVTLDQSIRTLELFAREVLPVVQNL